MARVSSRRGNAVGTPPTLSTMLALPKTPYVSPSATTWDSYNEPGPSTSFRSYNPSWDDQRRHHPGKRNATPSSLIRGATRLHIGNIGKNAGRGKAPGILPHSVQFRIPNLVSLCIRRKIRREVLHAKRRTNGRGSRRHNQWSKIACSGH